MTTLTATAPIIEHRTVTLWCNQGGHDKVWQCQIARLADEQGAIMVRRWGPRGGPMTGQTETFETYAAASYKLNGLVISKTKPRPTGRYFPVAAELMKLSPSILEV